ncbi:RNase A-like domain-containing protein [Catenulispora subtropica]|uniref:Bacterial CdiA-CT RNAse A domain-containing protein n=1 Tax=Catenulispora subtropica TaxID=450798 RepID=A0ABN2SPI0_9ACTN
MGRPSGWDVLGLDGDPTPGVVESVEALAKQFGDFAHDVESAYRSLNSFGGDAAALQWVGQTADTFKSNFGPLPGRLQKLYTSYSEASDALSAYAPKLLAAQNKADSALRQAQDTHADLQRATITANSAASDLKTAQQNQVVNPNQQAVTDAQTAHDTAQKNLDAAKGKLDALSAQAKQAHDDRISAAKDCARALHHAQSDGIHNKHWWQHVAADVLSTADDVLSSVGHFVEGMAYELDDILKSLFSPQSLLGIAETVAGLLMMVAGTGGEIGGIALDLTGVGALLGVPAAALSGGLIVAGGGLAAKGLHDWMAAMANGDYSSWPRNKRNGPQPPKLRNADPGGDEEYGGHSYGKHVGQSNDALADRLKNDPRPNAVSTYETYEDEERFAQMVVDKRRPDIIKWLRTAKPGDKQPFEVTNLDQVTGRSLSRSDWANGLPPQPVMGAKVVIKADPNAPNGYYILTSHPSGDLAPTWLPKP